jgi:hypothetical protein
VQWQLTGAGSLSNASGPSVTYTPPATVTADATVTIQATLPDPSTPLTRTVPVNVRAAIVNASATAAVVFTDQPSGIVLSAAPQFTGDPVSWSLNGPGSLSGTSGASISYLPPATLISITPATITATAGGVSQNLSVSVVPAAFKTLIASATQAFAGGAAVTLNANHLESDRPRHAHPQRFQCHLHAARQPAGGHYRHHHCHRRHPPAIL